MAEVKIPDSLPWVHEFIEDESSLIYTREGGFTEPHDDIYIVHAANCYPALINALKDIASGRGKCRTCGTLAYAPSGGGGVTDCDCTYPYWGPIDAAEHAAAALKAAGVET